MTVRVARITLTVILTESLTLNAAWREECASLTIILINESVLPYCRKCGQSIIARHYLNHSPQ